MKKLLVFILLVLSMSIPAVSNAASEPDDYVNLKAGWFWPNQSESGLNGFDPAMIYEFDYGRNFGDNFAVEVGGTFYEVKYNGLYKNYIGNYKVDFYGPLATLKGKMHPIEKLEIFLGAGGGYYWVQPGSAPTGHGAGWHVMAGTGYKVIKNLTVGIDGKYFGAHINSQGNWYTMDFGGIAASFYLKYMF